MKAAAAPSTAIVAFDASVESPPRRRPMRLTEAPAGALAPEERARIALVAAQLTAELALADERAERLATHLVADMGVSAFEELLDPDLVEDLDGLERHGLLEVPRRKLEVRRREWLAVADELGAAPRPEYFRRADLPLIKSRRRRGCDVDIPLMTRGGAAAATWIFRGDESRRDVGIPRKDDSRRRRGCDVAIPRRRDTAAAPSRIVRGGRTREGESVT